MRASAAALAALLASSAGPASAHGGLPGGGGFLSGALHPLVAVPHLVLLLGLGLLSARLPPERRGPAFAALGIGLLAGIALAQGGPRLFANLAPVAILGLAVMAGVLAALAPHELPGALVAALALPAGLAVGLDTDFALDPLRVGAALVAPIAGVAVGVYLIVLDAAALASLALRRPALSIATRVVGSWIAAIGLMLLSLSLAPDGAPG